MWQGNRCLLVVLYLTRLLANSYVFSGSQLCKTGYLYRPLSKKHGDTPVSRIPEFVRSYQTCRVSRATQTFSSFEEKLEIFMPSLSSTMKEGKIVQWTKKIGDKVNVGDTVMVVESDKADMDVESFYDGYLSRILVKEGGKANVGDVVAILSESAPEKTDDNDSDNISDKTAPTIKPVETTQELQYSEIFMPALSSAMKSGKISKWLKGEGDYVQAGDVVMVVESDKADMDLEVFNPGFIATILVSEGSIVNVGETVAVTVESRDSIPVVKDLFRNNFASSSKSSGNMAGNIASKSPPVVVEEAVLTGTKMDSYKDFSGKGNDFEFFVPHSCDQGIYGQLPSNISPKDLRESFYNKVISTEPGRKYFENLQQSPEGKLQLEKLLDRAEIRQPPSLNLLLETISNVPTFDLQKLMTRDANESAGGSTTQKQQKTIHKSPPGTAGPSARKFAADNNVDLSYIKGTGNFGRVTVEDIKKKLGVSLKDQDQSKIVSKLKTPLAGSVVALDKLQKAIAKNMAATLNVPVFRVSYQMNLDNFDALYKQLKSKDVTVSSMMAKAVSLALLKNPLLNSRYDEETSSIIYPENINIAMAVATDGGLITPVLKNPHLSDIFSISKQWKALVQKAIDRKLTPDEYTTGTFTISNLGMYGVSSFEAILPPNVGSILSVGAAIPTVKPSGITDNFRRHPFEVQKTITMTITCDHRHIYGAHAAQFLKDLNYIIETEPLDIIY